MNQILEYKQKNARWGILFFLFIIVVSLWGLSWYLITNSRWLLDWNARGTFGDMFGAVNALFSGLAFAGVIYAIYLQTKELKLQREELSQTRKEIERSASAQEATERALNKQVQLQALASSINVESSLLQGARLGTVRREDAESRIKSLREQVKQILNEFNTSEK
jgi:hypothetical protein